ncbi:MAG: PAS domain-containing sensor histidine kinase [Oceanicola sp.]|nr:PAS domain-containing sensor histidine kinase [Oceanicola sp.]
MGVAKAPVSDGFSLDRIVRFAGARKTQAWVTIAVVILGPVLAGATYAVLGPYGQRSASITLRLVLLLDLVYVLVLAALVLARVARMIADRRAQSAGSRLHLRLTGVFVGIALLPTVLVAVFAGLTINVGLEGWFSDRVRNVVGSSLAAAEAYETEQRQDLVDDALGLAGYLTAARKLQPLLQDGELRQLLTQGQAQIQRGLREAFIVNGAGELRLRGERSYLFDFEKPSPQDMEAAATGAPVVIEDWANNEFRALVQLEGFPDHYLYVSRVVDGSILQLLDETQETVGLYEQLEDDRGRILFQFGLLYLAFAVILLLASIWVGLWFAERLARPIGRLAGAAQQVGSGDLTVRVQEDEGDDEIAMLGRVFNQMTHQLKGQRDALLESSAQTEERRRLFDSVLSSVTAGVIGLDPKGRVEFMNRSALRLLDMEEGDDHHRRLAKAVPEFAGLLEQLRTEGRANAQAEIRMTRRGQLETLLVRMAARRSAEGGLEGYVVAFDDVSKLVTAQRMAAWGDVARRIAHEIKNPLTPIQLSAERIDRKFGRKLEGEDAASLENMTGVIVRQTGDLRRIVDEFSRFARMPEPERTAADITRLLRDAVTLQEQVLGSTLTADLPEDPVIMSLDPTMIGQALTNLIKNAGEAIESLSEKGTKDGYRGEVRVEMDVSDGAVDIRIMDNGIGLPADRARLFEPYVTTREKGTGLGLPIVKKIIEEHGGTLDLVDAPVFEGNTHVGAMAVISLPREAVVKDAAE